MADDDLADGQVNEETEATPESEAAAEGGAEEREAPEELDEEQEAKEALKKAMKVDVADIGVLRKSVTITLPRDYLDGQLDKDYKELISEAIVPGFRRGRAPRRLVEKRFGREVGEQVLTRVLPNAYLAAMEMKDLKTLGDPFVWVKVKEKKAPGEEEAAEKEKLLDMPTALTHIKVPEEGDLTLRCEVEVKPEFELPSIEAVAIEKPDMTVTDDDVTAFIDRMLSLRGNWVPVPDEAVGSDDLLVCDLTMSVDGKPVKTAENLQIGVRPQRIEGVVFEDFEEKVKDGRLGETRSLEGELPSDYEVEDLRGKKARFALKINEIKRLEVPEMDEAFISAQGFDSEEEYRAFVRQRLEGRLSEEVRDAMRRQVREYLLNSTKLDLPEGASTRQTERAVLRKMVELQRQGYPAAEIAKRVDELRTIAREEAAAQLKLHFILEEIAEKLEIEVSEEEINSQIASIAASYNRRFDRVRDELARNNGLESLYFEIRDEKCVDKILETAKVTEAKVERKAPPVRRKAVKKAPAKKAAAAAGRKTASGDESEGAAEKKAKPRRKPPAKS